MSQKVGLQDLTLSLITLNRPRELNKTLQMIGALPNIQVILNGADVTQYEDVMRERQDVRFIRNKSNIGVAAAWNQSIVISGTRFIVLSGDDLIYDPGWPDRLLELLNRDSPPEQVMLSEPTRLSAFCLDKKRLSSLGWFDHNFSRVYYEDEDWYLRTQERQGVYNRQTSWEELVTTLDVVHRHAHARAPWNSIPNRVYFWRKWKRLDKPEAHSFYLRPTIIVKRAGEEPRWPYLESIAQAYAREDFSERPFKYEKPAAAIRALTSATTNPFFIQLRQGIQHLTNPNQELR